MKKKKEEKRRRRKKGEKHPWLECNRHPQLSTGQGEKGENGKRGGVKEGIERQHSQIITGSMYKTHGFLSLIKRECRVALNRKKKRERGKRKKKKRVQEHPPLYCLLLSLFSLATRAIIKKNISSKKEKKEKEVLLRFL